MVCPYRFCVKLGGRDLVLVNVPVRGPAQSLWANPQKKKKRKKVLLPLPAGDSTASEQALETVQLPKKTATKLPTSP